MTMKITIFLLMSPLFYLATATYLPSLSKSTFVSLSRSKRQAEMLQCFQNIQSCTEKVGNENFQSAIINTEAFGKNCGHAEPYFTCIDDALSRCSAREDDFAPALTILLQMVEGLKAVCRDPKVAKLVSNPENKQCFSHSQSATFQQGILSCLLPYTQAILMTQESDKDICVKHDRFVSCVDTEISPMCSPQSRADYVYMIDVTLSGYTNARGGIKSCGGGASGGSPVKESISLRWIFSFAVILSIVSG